MFIYKIYTIKKVEDRQKNMCKSTILVYVIIIEFV